MTDQAGIKLTFRPSVSVPWPACGTAVVLLLLRPPHGPPLVARPLQEAVLGSNRQPFELAMESRNK